jgi:excisionase family DNA binding protein
MVDETPRPQFCTVSQAAATLQCSPSTIYRMIASGRLHAVRVSAHCLCVGLKSLKRAQQIPKRLLPPRKSPIDKGPAMSRSAHVPVDVPRKAAPRPDCGRSEPWKGQWGPVNDARSKLGRLIRKIVPSELAVHG